MVAGMLMPMHELKAIYEVLFRDGVMVAKKDKRPQIKHPEVREVTNLQVIRAMGSLKSRGYVRETFAWRHFYWYLTNDGIVYLRDYLHLPTEIIPASLQRVRKPAATLAIAHRAARVQSVQGPTSYVPKPGRRDEAESQEALAERQGYRHKMMDPGERGNYTDRTPRFRGRPLTDEPVRPKPSQEVRDQHQPLYSRGATWNSKSVKEETHQRLNVRHEKQMVSEERRMLDVQKRNSTSVPLQTAGLKQDASQTTPISSVALPLPVATAGVAGGSMISNMTVRSSAADTNVKIKITQKPEIAKNKKSVKATEEISPAVTIVPSGEVKEDKTKPAELTVTANEMLMPKPVLTMGCEQETSKVYSGSATSGNTKLNDVDQRKHRKEEPIVESVKATEKKAQVPVKAKRDGNIKGKTEEVNQKTIKPKNDYKTSNPSWTTDEAVGISNIRVTQKAVHAEVTPPDLTAKPDTDDITHKMAQVKESSSHEVKTYPDTAAASGPQTKQEDPQLTKKNVILTETITKQDKTSPTGISNAKRDEIVQPKEVSKVLGQDLDLEQDVIHTSVSIQTAATTEEGKDAKQVCEGTSKSKKKKSPGEMSKGTVKEDQPPLMAEGKRSENSSHEGMVENVFQQKTVITSESLTVSTSIKTEGKISARAKADSDCKKTDGQLPKDTFTKTKIISEETPTAASAGVQLREKPVTTTTQAQMCPKLKDTDPDIGPAKSKEVTVLNVETVTVQKMSQVELMQKTTKLEEKIPADQSDSQKITAVLCAEKVTDKPAKAKKKGKGKKQIEVSPEVETINTKSVLMSEGETLPSTDITLSKSAGKDSAVMASEITGTEVPSKMTPERMCSEEVRQAAAVLSEAPTDKGEVELTQPFAKKNKREVPKAKTSSSARKAPAPEDLASAEGQASPLFRQEEPPRVAQHSAGQAAECSTQERLSVSEAIEHEEDKKRDLVEDTPSATATPAAQPDQPHLGDISVSDIVDTDEATMRKKIVVVEEIVEVKQIVSPQAAGEQSPPPPVKTEVEEEELDLDVLEEIAKERALLIAAAEVKVQGASPDPDWDHSLGEPEKRTWPNFIQVDPNWEEGVVLLEALQ
ncbi:hypothetical protein CRENBAI_023628 [Crenichthys baileyi]|uniref:Plectin/eS10 N-terminal domain-containing protein n=1 Tax=Crenichthys baileyi TaxID=28760 RepID=A0AAV9SAB1_9TELE